VEFRSNPANYEMSEFEMTAQVAAANQPTMIC
jgi:hypothetical protein